MIFSREKKTYPTVHWYTAKGKRSFCGITNDQTKMTNDPLKVSCLLCKTQMKLHGHLPQQR